MKMNWCSPAAQGLWNTHDHIRKDSGHYWEAQSSWSQCWNMQNLCSVERMHQLWDSTGPACTLSKNWKSQIIYITVLWLFLNCAQMAPVHLVPSTSCWLCFSSAVQIVKYCKYCLGIHFPNTWNIFTVFLQFSSESRFLPIFILESPDDGSYSAPAQIRLDTLLSFLIVLRGQYFQCKAGIVHVVSRVGSGGYAVVMLWLFCGHCVSNNSICV